MISSDLDRVYLAALQANPLDLRSFNAQAAAQALYAFIQEHFHPGDECSLSSPAEAKTRGCTASWHVSWEAGPAEWGVLLSLGKSMWLTEFDLTHDHRPEVYLQSGNGWYAEPHFRFDIGFIESQNGSASP